jgi:hypothetical protein
MRAQKFFMHAAAIERFRLNTITSLDTSNGRLLTSHTKKLLTYGKNKETS